MDAIANAVSKAAPRFSKNDLSSVKQFYDATGFVILNDVFSTDDLSDFKTELRNIIVAHLIKAGIPHNDPEIQSDRIFTKGIRDLEAVDHVYVASIYDAICQSPSFFRILGNRHTEVIVKTLLGIDSTHPLYGFTNRCLIAPPSDNRRTYGWHQEVFYTIPESQYIQTWAPLIFDTTVNTGTIEILPASNQEGIARQSWNEVPGRALQIIVDDEIVAKYRPTVVEMKVGELLLFSGHLVHRSGENKSDSVRFSLVGMYHDVKNPTFRTPRLNFEFRGKCPRDHYDETFPKEC